MPPILKVDAKQLDKAEAKLREKAERKGKIVAPKKQIDEDNLATATQMISKKVSVFS